MSIENERFKAVREALSMTQQKFAEELAISPAAVRKIENGSTNLGINHAMKIHEKFGYSLDYLYGLTDSTNDAASTMLLYLRKLFRYECNAKSNFCHTVEIAQPIIDFLNSLAKADELLASGMPKQAYDLWLDQLKRDFDNAMNNQTNYSTDKYAIVNKRELVKSDPKPGGLS